VVQHCTDSGFHFFVPMSGSTLYGFWFSPNVQRALFAVYLKEAKIDLETMSLQGGDHKKPDFLAKSPLGQLPFLVDSDVKLGESRAIARYVNDRYNTGYNLSPDDNLVSRAVFEQWINFEATQLSPELQKIGFQRFFVPTFLKGTPDEKIIAESIKKVEPLLDALESQLRGKDYVFGRLTLVDVFIVPFVNMLFSFPEAYLLDKRTNIKKWYERIAALPAWKKVIEQGKVQK